ncbi:unnamed protein product [Coccothraustes coccothraustes]
MSYSSQSHRRASSASPGEYARLARRWRRAAPVPRTPARASTRLGTPAAAPGLHQPDKPVGHPPECEGKELLAHVCDKLCQHVLHGAVPLLLSTSNLLDSPACGFGT